MSMVRNARARVTWLSFLIGGVALVVYLPALKIKFYDGWWYLIWAATMDLPRYALQFLDPANITQGYRPVQGAYMYLLYHLFGFNPDGYHWAHNLLHATNAMLLFLITAKLSARWRLAFIAALIYAVLPNYALAVFWHAVVDPLTGFFYLLTLGLWTRFLDTRRLRDYGLAFVAFFFTLFSKEIAIFLPLFLFLIEWWFYRITPNPRELFPRYLPFLVTCIPYLWLVYQVQSHGEFVGQFGFRIGPHMLGNLIPYAAVLTFPWLVDLPTDPLAYLWLTVVVAVYVGMMIYKRSTVLFFLALFAILNISPLLGFPQDYFHPRYLYLSTTVSALVLALVLERVRQFIGTHRLALGGWCLAIVGLVVLSGVRVAESAAGLAEYTRQIRVPFSDIARQHPTFPPGSYVYLVHSPFTSFWDFEGLFFSRYGTNVKVNATDLGQPANLRAYEHAYVYYFDATGKPIEVPVERQISVSVQPTVPVQFDIPLVLENYEIPTTRLERGKAAIVILNWRALEKLDKDYTVFAHLLDGEGKRVAQADTPPGQGKMPTHEWQKGRLYVDALVIEIPQSVALGENYRIEIGWYDAETGQRIPIPETGWDKIRIEPLMMVDQERQ